MNKKRKNQKGFTLIELLAVVVILLAISVMAISSISAAVERNKEKQNDTKKAIIESYAELYYEDHKNSIGDSGCIPVSVLDLTEDEKKDADGKEFTGKVCRVGNTFKYSHLLTFLSLVNNTTFTSS